MPNMNNPAMRAMMVNGMRPQGAHPMDPQMQQMMAARMGAGGMMPGGAGFPPGQQPGGPPQGGMMPGQPQQQQPPQGGQPQNMTPRQGNMAPPPAPANAAANGANQPSSPAQPPAPPTPTQNKGGKNAKKDGKNSKVCFYHACNMYLCWPIILTIYVFRHRQRRVLPPQQPRQMHPLHRRHPRPRHPTPLAGSRTDRMARMRTALSKPAAPMPAQMPIMASPRVNNHSNNPRTWAAVRRT